MSGRTRGIGVIRTLAGAKRNGAQPKERHVAQFKIGCLELERSRRLKQKAVALDLVRGIDERVTGIEAEIRRLHEALGYEGSPPADREGSTAGGEPETAQPRRTIRYGG